MKLLSVILLVAAVGSGLAGMWIACANLAYASVKAWTWNSDDEEGE